MAKVEIIDGSKSVASEYGKIEESDVAINEELESTAAILDAHIYENLYMHQAINTIFSPILNVPATEVQTAIAQVNERVTNIVASPGISDQEVVDARLSAILGVLYGALTDRFEHLESNQEGHPALVETLQSIASITPEVSSNAKTVMDGLSVVNDIENSDISNGTVGWDVSYSSHSAINNILSNLANGSNANPSEEQENIFDALVGDKVFVLFPAKVPTECNEVRLYIRNGTANGQVKSFVSPSDEFDIYSKLFTISTELDFGISLQHRYADAATANGKIMDIDGTIGVKAINISNGIDAWLTAHGYPTDNDKEAFLAEMCRKGVIDGLQGIVNLWLKTVGKNLLDIYDHIEWLKTNGDNVSTSDNGGDLVVNFGMNDYVNDRYIMDVKENSQYTLSLDAKVSGTGLYLIIYYTDGTEDVVLVTSSLTFEHKIITTDINKTVESITWSYASGLFVASIKSFQIEEGTLETDYEDFKHSENLIPTTLHSLPNGVTDKLTISKSGGVQKLKNIGTGDDGKGYVLQSADIVALNTSLTNLDVVKFNDFADSKSYDSVSTDQVYADMFAVTGFTPKAYVDSINNEYTQTNDSSVNLRILLVPKGTYANIGEAQTDLAEGGPNEVTLIYQLAEPIIEDLGIANVSMFKDYTQISVDSGKMYEKANPILTSNYYLNDIGAAGSELSEEVYSIDKIIKVIFDDLNNRVKTDDTNNWTFASGGGNGLEKAFISAADFDTSAEYYVEYTMLYGGSHGELIDVTYERNILDALDTVVQAVSELSKKVEPAPQEGWIEPTLLNGWVNFESDNAIVGFYKDSLGSVHIKGFIKDGVVTANTDLFSLPEKYRPSETLYIGTISNSSLAGIKISSNGLVEIGFGVSSTWLSLNNISFRAEQ